MLVKQRFVMILTVSILLAVSAGCGTDHAVYFKQINADTEHDTEDGAEAEAGGAASDDTGLAVSQTGQGRYAVGEESRDGQDVTGLPDDSQATEVTEEPVSCYVYVCGAVRSPGVYILAAGSRIYEAVEMAGGLTEEASEVSVNQAGTVADGQMLYIPTKEEAESGIAQAGIWPGAGQGSANEAGDEGGTGRGAVDGAGDRAGTGQGSAAEAGGGTGQGSEYGDGSEDGRVNLNTATAEELMTLPGIGTSKAADIIAYREDNGGFDAPEEIMQISGIKEGLYNRIKDDIKVK